MQFLYYALFAAGIVAVDQLSKYFTVAYIPLYTDISFIPGVLNLTYVQNSGAAFSSFEGQQWLFALIFLFFTGLIVWEYFKKKMAFTPFERWCIAAIYGGGWIFPTSGWKTAGCCFPEKRGTWPRPISACAPANGC